MSIRMTRDAIISNLPEGFRIAHRTRMTRELSRDELKAFARDLELSVYENGSLKMSHIMCGYFSRRFLMWQAHYWAHKDQDCVYCKFIGEFMNVTTQFVRNPDRAQELLKRLEP